MNFHLLLPRVMHLPESAVQAAARLVPRHGMGLLAHELQATVHEPDSTRAHGQSRWRTLVAPPADLWTLAEDVASTCGSGDTIFCSSEAGGLQLAAVCGASRSRPRIAVFVHNVDRPRARFALEWWKLADKIDLFMACSCSQIEFLRRYLKLPEDRLQHVWDHTDTRFFTPGPMSSQKRRPTVVSVGLEQRDYRTLAMATRDLDLDVRISGFSKDAGAMARTFPDTLPANMSRRFYEWPELVQLYRDADVVVVSCHENRYAAGVQSLMEAMACGRPVIATATEGLKAYLDDSVITVPPADAAAMREAIQRALADKAGSEERALRGHKLALRRYDLDGYVVRVAGALRSLG